MGSHHPHTRRIHTLLSVRSVFCIRLQLILNAIKTRSGNTDIFLLRDKRRKEGARDRSSVNSVHWGRSASGDLFRSNSADWNTERGNIAQKPIKCIELQITTANFSRSIMTNIDKPLGNQLIGHGHLSPIVVTELLRKHLDLLVCGSPFCKRCFYEIQ